MIETVLMDIVTLDMCSKDLTTRAPSKFKGIVVTIPEDACK
jgi:hypothetical protein